MALPSLVTIGSLAFVVVAGAGYAVMATASANPDNHSSHVASGHRSSGPSLPAREKPIPSPHSASAKAIEPKRDAVPNVLVDVYNNTGITGLATQKAAVLQGAGWNVAGTDNWYGNIPSDTVYYPPQLRPAAVKLAKALHITRLRPAVAPMEFDRLTVILATG
jgi:hypothetical protein